MLPLKSNWSNTARNLLAVAALSLLVASCISAEGRSADADSGGGLQQGVEGGLQEEGGDGGLQKAELPTLEIDVLRVPAEFFQEEGSARAEIRLSGDSRQLN